MLDTFKARLKAKSTAAGVNNLTSKRLDAMAAKLDKQFPDLTEEKDHDEKIDLVYAPDDFKEMGAFDDYQRTKTAREAKEKADKEKKGSNSSDQSNNDDQSSKDEMPAWFKDYAAKIDRIESEKKTTSLKQKLSSDLLKDVPEVLWSKRALPEKEEDLQAFAEDVKSDFANLVKESSEKGLTVLSKSTPAASGGTDTKDKAISPEVKAFVEKNKQTVTK